MIFLLGACALVAAGDMLARRPPRWLDDDPLLHPFGLGAPGSPSPLGDGSSPPAASPAEEAPAWPIDLATADAATLTHLPGVGPVLAGRIVAHRDSLGGIRTWEQLDAVAGVGPRTLERIRPLLRLSAAEGDSAATASAAGPGGP